MAYDIAQLFYQWESFGVFDLILPFLLMFAFVLGVLTSSNFISKQKGINVVIALVVALMALRFGFVEFFAQVFPRLGVGIAVLLVFIILVAAFIPKEHMGGWLIAFYSLGAIIAIVAIYNSFSNLNWFGSYTFWNDNTVLIVSVLAVIGVVIAISSAGNKNTSSQGITLPIAPIRGP